MSRYSTRQFHYDKTKNRFVADASDLTPRPRAYQTASLTTALFCRIYPDACDPGLTLTSHVTGHSVDFVVYLHDETDEGEITAWYLKPVKRGAAGNSTIIIFND